LILLGKEPVHDRRERGIRRRIGLVQETANDWDAPRERPDKAARHARLFSLLIGIHI
jgi:hypothetical protein